jgi:hypothetical protein
MYGEDQGLLGAAAGIPIIDHPVHDSVPLQRAPGVSSLRF